MLIGFLIAMLLFGAWLYHLANPNAKPVWLAVIGGFSMFGAAGALIGAAIEWWFL